jgi:pimeloyl-ACP methyl ester carboxylesterase
MWALATFARPVLARLAGVPKGFPLTAADRRSVTGLTSTFFPVVPRAEGVIFDWFVSFPDVNHYDLEAITVPVLIVHVADDPVASYDAAQHAAGRIPAPASFGCTEAATSCPGRKKPSGPGSLLPGRARPTRRPAGTGARLRT